MTCCPSGVSRTVTCSQSLHTMCKSRLVQMHQASWRQSAVGTRRKFLLNAAPMSWIADPMK